MGQRAYYKPLEQKKTLQLYLFTFLLVLTCVLLGIYSGYRYFRIVHIECHEAGSECEPKYEQLLSMYVGRSLFSKIQPQVLGKKVSVTKKYPQTLIIDLENQEIFTRVFLDESKSSAVVVYTDGTIMPIEQGALSSPSAGLVITDSTLTVPFDSTVLSQDRYAVYTNLLEFSKTTVVKEVLIRSDDEIVIKTERGLDATVSGASLKNELHSLQLLLVSPTIEQKPARVDLRFDRPVLQYY